VVVEHEGRRPQVDPTAWVAPTAVLSGDVRVGPDCRVLFGAVLTDDGGPVELGAQSIVMESALIRGRASHPARIGRHVVVGPHAHLNGVVVEDDAFIATGAALFPGTAFGLPRDTPDLAAAATRRYAEVFGRHRSDRVLAEE
jgi:carbonic anhydrase/acetyltransferase-like protein (isoleucine patch superfamily)